MSIFVSLIGLALVSGASAQANVCELAASVPAISPYVEHVRSRAQRGRERALEAQRTTDFFKYVFPWASRVGSTVLQSIDSSVRLVEQRRDLLDRSACLHFDVLLLECEIERTRAALNAAFARESIGAITQLQSLYLFLEERLRHLLRGAKDAAYADVSWTQTALFDPPDAKPPPAPLCPFHSDYLASTPDGFGCDRTVLSRLASLPPVVQGLREFRAIAEETKALQKAGDDIDFYRREMDERSRVQRAVQTLIGKIAVPAPVMPKREHALAFGCREQGGLCSRGALTRCTTDADCMGGGGACVRDVGVCSLNHHRICLEDAHCAQTKEGACVPPKQVQLLETRGPFSPKNNHVSLLWQFTLQRLREGESRMFSDLLKLPEEFPTGEEKKRDASRNISPLTQALKTAARGLFRKLSRIQGQAEGVVFPQASDASLTISQSLSPLRSSIAEFSRLASGREGLRRFTADYAYFLLRSCLHRPCRETLERIIRLAFTDECFPYADGQFIADIRSFRSIRDGKQAGPFLPRVERCKRAAGL